MKLKPADAIHDGNDGFDPNHHDQHPMDEAAFDLPLLGLMWRLGLL